MRKKWEEIYEKYQNGTMDSRLEELKAKVANKTIKKEEYKEIKKIENVKGNLGKINNIIELQNKIEEEAEKLQEEILKMQENTKIEDLDKEIQKLEKELEELDAKKTELTQKIKTTVDKEEKAKLEEELKSVDKKIEDNNSKYSKNMLEKQEIVKENEESKDLMTVEEKQDKWNALKNKSSKCNLVIVNLLKGNNWNEIDRKLEGYQERKFDCKQSLRELGRKIEKQTQKIIKEEATKTEEVKAKTVKVKAVKAEAESTKTESAKTEQEAPEKPEETGMSVQSEFDRKHPRLAKFRNWFKNIFSKKEVQPSEVGETKPEATKAESSKEDKKENVNNEMMMNKIMNSNDNEFKRYLKEYAEKGQEQLAKEARIEIMRRAKEQAYDREANNPQLGKDYAERSYHKDDDKGMEIWIENVSQSKIIENESRNETKKEMEPKKDKKRKLIRRPIKMRPSRAWKKLEKSRKAKAEEYQKSEEEIQELLKIIDEAEERKQKLEKELEIAKKQVERNPEKLEKQIKESGAICTSDKEFAKNFAIEVRRQQNELNER